jgi:hypothetical protein
MGHYKLQIAIHCPASLGQHQQICSPPFSGAPDHPIGNLWPVLAYLLAHPPILSGKPFEALAVYREKERYFKGLPIPHFRCDDRAEVWLLQTVRVSIIDSSSEKSLTRWTVQLAARTPNSKSTALCEARSSGCLSAPPAGAQQAHKSRRPLRCVWISAN